MNKNIVNRINCNSWTVYIVAIVAFFAFPTHGLCSSAHDEINLDSGYEEVFSPQIMATSILIDDDNELPNEPNIGKVKFTKYPPLSSIKERIDRLLHGIRVYITPENDHYGHEIRRYMAHVGNIEIYKDNEYLLEQYRNIKKAKVIAQYWQKHIEKEIREIEEIVKKDESVSLGEHTSFRQNKVTANSFLITLKSWIDANEQLLEKIGKRQEVYSYKHPEVVVSDSKEMTSLFNLLSVRAAKLKDIKSYSSFSMMVY